MTQRRAFLRCASLGLAGGALAKAAAALSGAFDVKAFGAKGDGTTVDTSAINKAIEDPPLNIGSLRAEAYLPSIQKDRVADPIDRFFKIAIGKNDRRILAPEFERYRLHSGGNRLHNGSTRLRFSGERNCINILVLSEKFARRVWPESVDDVVHTVWDAGFLHHFRQQCRSCRSFFRRLDDYRVATC